MAAHKAGNLERTAQPVGSSTGWQVPFQAAPLVSASSTHRVWSPRVFEAFVLCVLDELSLPHLSLTLGFYCLLNLVSFRDFLKDFLSGLPSRTFSTGWNVSISGNRCITDVHVDHIQANVIFAEF